MRVVLFWVCKSTRPNTNWNELLSVSKSVLSGAVAKIVSVLKLFLRVELLRSMWLVAAL